MAQDLFNTYLSTTRTIADIEAATSVLSWDQETYMPEGGAGDRAEQLSTLSAMAHRMTTDLEYRGIIDRLASDGENLEQWQRAAIRESHRNVEKQARLPEEHVRDLSRATSLALESWKRARAASDFSIFADSLSQLVSLKRQETEYLGYKDNPYDALIDIYEPGATVADLNPVFDRLRTGTVELLERVKATGITIDDSVLHRQYPADQQLAFARETIAALGFDFDNGRIDLSAHPFCTSFGVGDVRLTTRILPNDLRSCLFGLIHEAGHGMYEQGFDSRLARTPLASGISMGIHESQSLFWENMIARSEQFWEWAFPRLANTFGSQLSGVTPYKFYQAINVVQPSLIRIEADELTYNLHIMLRFKIEEALINGRMDVADIPEAWNNEMRESLGITPPNDADGCLQDVHWSFAGFGYFPSYTLGKLYAAMFSGQLHRDLPSVDISIARGEFDDILGWLREKIHRWGKGLSSAELVKSVCGAPLSEIPFLEYNRRKIDRVYSDKFNSGIQ